MVTDEIKKSPVFCDLCEEDVAEYHAFKGEDEFDLIDSETISISLCEDCLSKTSFDDREDLQRFAVMIEQMEVEWGMEIPYAQILGEFIEGKVEDEKSKSVLKTEKRIAEILTERRTGNSYGEENGK